MSALFGLMFGIGALLIYMSFWELPAKEKKNEKSRRYNSCCARQI